ncbi:unnamed protein product, partial [Polarella glacialis]
AGELLCCGRGARHARISGAAAGGDRAPGFSHRLRLRPWFGRGRLWTADKGSCGQVFGMVRGLRLAAGGK